MTFSQKNWGRIPPLQEEKIPSISYVRWKYPRVTYIFGIVAKIPHNFGENINMQSAKKAKNAPFAFVFQIRLIRSNCWLFGNRPISTQRIWKGLWPKHQQFELIKRIWTFLILPMEFINGFVFQIFSRGDLDPHSVRGSKLPSWDLYDPQQLMWKFYRIR